jgi:CheY-specific phosphatase CheX
MATSAIAREPILQSSKQLRLIVEATIEVCAAMQRITLNVSGDPFLFSMSHLDCFEVGSCITVRGPDVNWNIAIFSSEACCKQLVALMLGALPSDIGLEEMVDAFGETVNIIAGRTKRRLPTNNFDPIHIGIPQFLDGSDCIKYLSSGADVYCQQLSEQPSDHGSTIELAVVWKEYKPL